MSTYVPLLRGINVGGHNRVAMPELRQVVTSLGHTDVATYIQSGNVVFAAKPTDTAALSTDLEQAITKSLGVKPRVVVLSREELAKVVDANPYQDEPDPRKVHVIFLGDNPGAEAKKAVASAERHAAHKGGNDTAQVVGRAIFLHTPEGFGRSELAALLARGQGPSAMGTARNWATVTKLLAMCDDLGS